MRMKNQLAKLDLLILDELGYVPASKLGSELLFDVISAAYERTSVIVTTNLPFRAVDRGSGQPATDWCRSRPLDTSLPHPRSNRRQLASEGRPTPGAQ